MNEDTVIVTAEAIGTQSCEVLLCPVNLCARVYRHFTSVVLVLLTTNTTAPLCMYVEDLGNDEMN